MEVKYEVTVTTIGSLARTFLADNHSVIILDEGVRPNLAEMVMEHTPGTLKADLKAGDQLVVGNSKYKVMRVGDKANETIRAEGHCTLVFNAEGSMPGQIILQGKSQPSISIGTNLVFQGK